MNMPCSTPKTAKTIAIEPKVAIWKRCMAMESVARVWRTPRMRKSWTKMENHRTPTEPLPSEEDVGRQEEGGKFRRTHVVQLLLPDQ